MLIRDIAIADVMAGKNWRILAPAAVWLDDPMEDWGPIEECTDFDPTDLVVYSGLVAYPSGGTKAFLLIKEVREIGYGGDYCELVDGAWRQLGLVPNPDTEVGRDFIANPLPNDPSFTSFEHDYREHHRSGFRHHASTLRTM